MNEQELKSDIFLLEKEICKLEEQIFDLQNEILNKAQKMERIFVEANQKRLKLIQIVMVRNDQMIEKMKKELEDE